MATRRSLFHGTRTTRRGCSWGGSRRSGYGCARSASDTGSAAAAACPVTALSVSTSSGTPIASISAQATGQSTGGPRCTATTTTTTSHQPRRTQYQGRGAAATAAKNAAGPRDAANAAATDGQGQAIAAHDIEGARQLTALASGRRRGIVCTITTAAAAATADHGDLNAGAARRNRTGCVRKIGHAGNAISRPSLIQKAQTGDNRHAQRLKRRVLA